MSKRRRRKKRPSIWPRIFLLVILAGVGLYGWNRVQASLASTDETTALQFDKLPSKPSIESNIPWWNNDFGFRRQIEIPAEATTIGVTLNHQALVASKQSLLTGNDIRVVAQLQNTVEEVPIAIQGVNTALARVIFSVSKYPQAKFFLYYGSKSPQAVLAAQNTLGAPTPGSLGQVETPTLAISTSRTWHLLKDGKTQLTLDWELQQAVFEDKKIRLYYYLNSLPKPIEISTIGDQLNLEISDVTIGLNTLFLIAIVDGDLWRSNSLHFLVSDPVMVAWTIDWEGYDVKDWTLEAMAAITSRYHIPLTLFFNPRIYIDQKTPSYRRSEITNWVMQRHLEFGDEIAMHMHMQYDMVRAAGIEPLSSPRWGSGIDGYDVATSAYTTEQFTAILKWGLQQFENAGLPKPVGYRAGGWFANMATLQALEATGFTYDASGREPYKFGRKELPGHWALEHTAQPYKPSISDQNSSEPPQMNLWEIPNNGNDSYWFGTDELINRFYMNYNTPGQPVTDPKLITYLSHPDWFDVDQPKLESLFTEISKFSYEQDLGPVIYVKLSEALDYWR